jgi:hypothetical protein
MGVGRRILPCVDLCVDDFCVDKSLVAVWIDHYGLGLSILNYENIALAGASERFWASTA